MRPTRTSRSARTLVAGLATAALVLTACSEDSAEPGEPDADAVAPSATIGSASASPTPYLPVPEGVELTPQGTELEVGEEAVVAYEPRKGEVAVLGITVDRLEKTTLEESFQGWQLDKRTRKANPYFVRATVTNEGETQLGGRRLEPLYIVDGTDTLIEASSFASRFKPCPSEPLPKKFGPGKETEVCLVYLAPDGGDLTAVSFRPTEDFVPITWTGPLKKVKGQGKDGRKAGNNRDRG